MRSGSKLFLGTDYGNNSDDVWVRVLGLCVVWMWEVDADLVNVRFVRADHPTKRRTDDVTATQRASGSRRSSIHNTNSSCRDSPSMVIGHL